MKIEEIIFILENKIKNLEQQKNVAVMAGDLEMVTVIDIQIVETQITLDTLKNT
jgi:hypothetical protein